MAEPTLFEKILSGTIPSNFVARGETWGAFLDVYPRRSGHTLVTPTRPVRYLAQLPPDELFDLMKGVQEVQNKLSQYFDTDDFSVIVHDGPLAGQEIPHLHIHIIPRTKEDGGKTLLAMWPNSPPPRGQPEFDKLTELCNAINGV